MENREKLITDNMNLARKIAREYASFDYSKIQDLESEGFKGLCEAADRFDSTRGYKFITYAGWWVRAEILAYLMNSYSLVKIGTTQAQRKLFFRLRREQESLRKEGLSTDNKTVADRCKVREQDVMEMGERLAVPVASLDANCAVGTEGDQRSLYETVDSGAPNPEDYTTKRMEIARVQSAMITFEQKLCSRDLAVWNGRIAREHDDKLTLESIGASIGKTKARVQQIEKSLVERFVTFYKKNN